MLTKAAKSQLKARIVPTEDVVLEDFGNGRVRTAKGVVIKAKDQDNLPDIPVTPDPESVISTEAPGTSTRRRRSRKAAPEGQTPSTPKEVVGIEITGIKLSAVYLHAVVSDTVIVLSAPEPPPFVPPVFSYDVDPNGAPVITLTIRGNEFTCAYTGMSFTDHEGNKNIILVRL